MVFQEKLKPDPERPAGAIQVNDLVRSGLVPRRLPCFPENW